jgi:hypothetical protein
VVLVIALGLRRKCAVDRDGVEVSMLLGEQRTGELAGAQVARLDREGLSGCRLRTGDVVATAQQPGPLEPLACLLCADRDRGRAGPGREGR